MKIRQKIAMLLAAAMTLTAVPMVTMAKSDFSLTKGIQVAKKGVSVSSALKVEMKDVLDTTTAMFFVNLENAEWDGAPTGATTIVDNDNVVVKWKKNNSKEVEVTVEAGPGTSSTSTPGKDTFQIPFTAELKGGDATIAVSGYGTVISDLSPVVFARTTDSKATVKAGDPKSIYKSGLVADITIEESIAGTIGSNVITVSLDNTDYTFDGLTARNIKLSRGFSDKTVNLSSATVSSDEFTFTVSGASDGAPGRIVIEKAPIKLKGNRSAVVGDDISVTVSGTEISETSVQVAEAQELGNTIVMEDKKVVEVVAGRSKKISFSIKENVNDSILDNREIEVRFDKVFLADTTDGALATNLVSTIESKATIDSYTAGNAITGVTLATDDDDRIIGFDFKVLQGVLSGTATDEIEFEDIEVFVPVNVEGEVTVSAAGRALGTEIETVALNVTAPVKITSEAYTLKVGLKDQKGGKIVIAETDKGMLKQGKDLVIKIDDKDSGFEFSDDPTITIDGDLQLDVDNLKISTSGDTMTIPVKRASKTASTITITEIPVDVNRSVPQGTYDLKLSGLALTPDCTIKSLTVEDFIIIGTPNTEDITTNGLKKGTAAFVIGSSKYVVNGVEAEMDGAVYLDNGRTMVPVRYVANALGVPATDIFFASGTATILAGSKTVSLTVGDKVAKLNGVPARTMTAAPVVKDGRTYVPVAEIGALLGVEAVWDSAAQSATFTNK